MHSTRRWNGEWEVSDNGRFIGWIRRLAYGWVFADGRIGRGRIYGSRAVVWRAAMRGTNDTETTS